MGSTRASLVITHKFMILRVASRYSFLSRTKFIS